MYDDDDDDIDRLLSFICCSELYCCFRDFALRKSLFYYTFVVCPCHMKTNKLTYLLTYLLTEGWHNSNGAKTV